MAWQRCGRPVETSGRTESANETNTSWRKENTMRAARDKSTKPARHSSLSVDLLRKMDAYWRAANYLSVGQIYLYDNPLLKRPLTKEHVKPRLLGHWARRRGSTSSTCT